MESDEASSAVLSKGRAGPRLTWVSAEKRLESGVRLSSLSLIPSIAVVRYVSSTASERHDGRCNFYHSDEQSPKVIRPILFRLYYITAPFPHLSLIVSSSTARHLCILSLKEFPIPTMDDGECKQLCPMSGGFSLVGKVGRGRVHQPCSP